MLGLPSTTEVGRRLPKEAFYRNLKLDARTRDEFVHLIESITIANSVKATTANLNAGERVHEIMVLDIRLKGDAQPVRAIEAIASANPHMLVFCTEPGGVIYVLRKGMHTSTATERLDLVGKDLDTVWDAICSQVIFADADGASIDARIDLAKQRTNLEAEIAKLDAACRKARQINRRNELFTQLKAKQRELRQLEAAEKGK